jgi:hypothetical protein
MQSDPKTVIPDNFIVTLLHDYLIHIDERIFPFEQKSSWISLGTVDDVCIAPKEEWESKTVRRNTTICWLPLQTGQFR